MSPFGPLVGVEWLAEHLDHDPLRVADTRWYLGKPGAGRAAYEAGHIPGATFLDIDDDLSLPAGAGRHPLPPPEVTAERLAAAGIGDRNFVVAYDDVGAQYAARLWWMLRSLGHQRVAVLDGGIQAWRDAGGKMETDTVVRHPATLSILGAGQTIDRNGLATRLGDVTLIDARAAERYRGDVEPIDAAAGHIPTAINVPSGGNLGSDGRFLPPGELRERYVGAGVRDAASAVVYCGSGVTACHDILAMEAAGLGTATLYPGSWSDWSSAGMPMATGDDPGSA
jgi:thiosulfate/3-mercaptopyruvate sulfurtransferase